MSAGNYLHSHRGSRGVGVDTRGDHGILEVGDKRVLQHGRGDVKGEQHHIPEELDCVVRDLGERRIPPILLKNSSRIHLLNHASRVEAGLADGALPRAVFREGLGTHFGVHLCVVKIERLIGAQTIQVEGVVPLVIIYGLVF